MKNLFRNPVFYVCSWFVGVSIFAFLVSSCSTHKTCSGFCSAYCEVMTPEKAEFMLKQDDGR